MAISDILKGIHDDFERFELEIEKFSRHITILAKNNLKGEIEQLRRIEKDKEKIKALEQEISDKKLFSDICVEGINNLEINLKNSKKKLVHDERKFFFGNAFAHSAVGFEKEMLKQIEKKAKDLHKVSTAIQFRIKNAIEFAEKELNDKIEINKHDLFKKSLSLAEINIKLLQGLVYLANMKLDSSEDIEHYSYEKNKILSDARNLIDIEESNLFNAAEKLSSFYFADFHRTRALRE